MLVLEDLILGVIDFLWESRLESRSQHALCSVCKEKYSSKYLLGYSKVSWDANWSQSLKGLARIVKATGLDSGEVWTFFYILLAFQHLEDRLIFISLVSILRRLILSQLTPPHGNNQMKLSEKADKLVCKPHDHQSLWEDSHLRNIVQLYHRTVALYNGSV